MCVLSDTRLLHAIDTDGGHCKLDGSENSVQPCTLTGWSVSVCARVENRPFLLIAFPSHADVFYQMVVWYIVAVT